MFWGKENWDFFQNLRAFNLTLPQEERIYVASIDIEYKMESAIFVINEIIGEREIPASLESTVGAFKTLFQRKKNHREQYHSFHNASMAYGTQQPTHSNNEWLVHSRTVLTDL